MAFTGTPVVKQISDRQVRITGVSLAAGASGVIGLFGKTVAPDITLPRTFQVKDYKFDDVRVTLPDMLDCQSKDAATGVATKIPISIVKSGTSKASFSITLTNDHGSLASPNQEITIRIHD